jgi:hypothetical protein
MLGHCLPTPRFGANRSDSSKDLIGRGLSILSGLNAAAEELDSH